MSIDLARRLKNRKNHRPGTPHRAGRAAIASVMESFEQRLLFAYSVVNTLSDDTAADSVLSLREAVALVENGGNANAALGRSLTAGELGQINLSQPFGSNDKIVFDNSVAGGTINMGSHLVINNSSAVTIDGGSSGLTLSGGSSVATWRAFDVSGAGNLTLKHLTLNHFGNVGGSTGGQGTIAGDGAGGAIYNNSGTVTIDNCTFSNNSVLGGSSNGMGSIAGRGVGGAVYSDSGTLTISNSTFNNNSAKGGSTNGQGSISGSGNGGAIYFSAGTFSIYNCALYNNSVQGGSAGGLGSGARSGDGGAIYCGTGFSISPPATAVNVANSTLTGNTATGFGGAIYNSGATIHLSFLTISGNTANAGRAVYLSAGMQGGLGGPENSPSTTATIDNSILGQSDNSSADLMLESNQFNFGGTVNLSGSHNLIRNTAETGITYSSADPLLGTLQNNGGPTQTMALLATSPAIRAAGSGGNIITFANDQRGKARPLPGHEDIGAFQTPIGNTRPFATGSGDRNGDVQIYNADRTPRSSIKNPFPGFGNRVVVADVTGDGVAEVIVAAGRGARPKVAIFDGNTGTKTREFMAFPKNFRDGLFVTTGDVNNDGISDIIVGQGAHEGSKGKIRVFSGTDLSLLMDFKAFDSGSAVSVAAADINGDGYADIIAMQGASDGPSKLSVFDGQNLTRNITTATSTFNPFGRKYHGGGCVTTGNVAGDGTPEIIVSQQTGRNPRISIFSGASKTLLSTFQTTSSGGATVASRDFNNDGFDDIFTNVIRNHSSTMEVFSGVDGTLLDSWKIDSKTVLSIG